MIAMIESNFAPGTVFRVQVTAIFGRIACDASTMRRVAVAMPEAISTSVCATFQLRCRAAAGSKAVKITPPPARAAPEDS